MNLYHGTELEAALKIKDNGFSAHHNDEHWLGNGIYFFEDEYMAKWWTTSPTLKYRPKIKKPSILHISIDFDKDNIKVLDLRKFKEYQFCAEQFNEYCKNMIFMKNKKTISGKAFISLFFDWVRIYYGYNVIIGNFYNIIQNYYDLITDEFKSCNGLIYAETQICVSEVTINSHIADFELEELKQNER